MENKVIQINKEARKRAPGERSIYTQQVIARMKRAKEGEIIPYEELDVIIGMGTRPQHEGYGYQYTARNVLERDHKIVFEAIDNVGLKRLSAEEIAKSTIPDYIKKTRSLVRRSTQRIGAIDEVYGELSDEAKMKATYARTILAFMDRATKPKSLKTIEMRIEENCEVIGFKDTLKLFDPNDKNSKSKLS